MEWWQVLIIMLGACISGIIIGYAVSYLIKKRFGSKFNKSSKFNKISGAIGRYQPFVPTKSAAIAKEYEAKAVAQEKKAKEKVSMTPLFSRRSIIVLGIGLIMGIGLGLVYWMVSPALSQMQTDQIVNRSASYSGPYSSTVRVQIVNTGASYMSLRELDQRGQYYAMKAMTFPFLKFLSQELAEQAPQYPNDIGELTQLIRIRYDYNSEFPVVELRAIASNEQEALFIVSLLPQIFMDFLIEEERNIQLEEYQSVLEEIEATSVMLQEAQKELNRLTLEANAYDINLDPVYIELSAKVAALEEELATRARQVAILIAEGDTSAEYRDAQKAMEETSLALSEARSEVVRLQTQTAVDYFTQNWQYQDAITEVQGLRDQLDDLNSRALSLTQDIDEKEFLSFLAVGEPSEPTPVFPETIRGRNAALMGGVLGLSCAWIVLNRKWLSKGLLSSAKEDEEEV